MKSWENRKLSNNVKEDDEVTCISHNLCILSLREENGQKIFVKRYKDEDCPEALREVMVNRILRKSKNQNFVVKYFGCFSDKNEKLNLKFEYSQVGTLFDYYINEIQKMENKNEIIKKFITQIVKALIIVHKQGIIHNDLKLENILLFKNRKGELIAKLADFNNSLLFDGEKIIKFSDFDSSIPSSTLFPYLIEYPNFKSDYLCLGVVVYQLFTGKHSPFEKCNVMEINRRMRRKEYLHNEDLKKMNPTMRDLLERLFEYDPTMRLGDEDILEHPYFKFSERKRIRLIRGGVKKNN
jgi:serine/threonine protein kinase